MLFFIDVGGLQLQNGRVFLWLLLQPVNDRAAVVAFDLVGV